MAKAKRLGEAMRRALWIAVRDPRGLVDGSQVRFSTRSSLIKHGFLIWRGALWPGKPKGTGSLFQITPAGLIALARAEDWEG